MTIYYAESTDPGVKVKPRICLSNAEARRLFQNLLGDKLLVIYHESNTKDGKPFIIDWEKPDERNHHA